MVYTREKFLSLIEDLNLGYFIDEDTGEIYCEGEEWTSNIDELRKLNQIRLDYIGGR